ncbi:hypothetical protein FAES_0358 [Fibrella aestuarina BUZ 2]|uniref:Uncharacterized protein n=1 Tax=Fibrella aestuarina BUZ 2 TaxID=1166018 RepID=I0K2L8_9BACT|nr:hypothetical protein [Fibrella aestuarina]CCG98371.1 hypothetical protein FAES_0358 [Fibrella aestuarina BUZ 2]
MIGMTKTAFFNDEEVIQLGKLLIAVEKNEPITEKQRRFAAMLFVKLDAAVMGRPSQGIRPSLSPLRHTKKRR